MPCGQGKLHGGQNQRGSKEGFQAATPRNSGAWYLADHIAGAKYVELRGDDHFPWVGDIDAPLGEVEEFLTGVCHSPEVYRVLSEGLPLKWANVDLEAGTARLDPGITKNKDGRLIYLTLELQDLLEKQGEEHLAHYPECPLVFHNQERPIVNYKRWHRACREARLDAKIPHDFRRTAVRNMVRVGIPERVAMQISGHKTRAIFDRYHIVSDGDLREAARRLESTITVPCQRQQCLSVRNFPNMRP